MEEKEREVYNELTSQFFKVESGQQLISFLIGSKMKKGKDGNVILCLVKRKEKTLEQLIARTIATAEIVAFEYVDKKLTEKKKYKLKKLSKIEGGNKERETEVTFYWGTSYHFKTESVDKRNIFLWKLLQLITETYNFTPELINITHLELSFFSNPDEEEDIVTEVEMNQEDLFTKDEELMIMKILEQYKIEISDSKKLQQILRDEIEKSEIENIHEILEKQEQWSNVLSLLIVCEKHLSYMDGWLMKYNDKLQRMRREIEQIESENNYMETQARNLNNLDLELMKLMNRLDITKEIEENLKKKFEENTTEKSLKGIIEGVNYIENGITGEYLDGMEFMISVQDRKKIFQEKRLEIVKRFKDYLINNLFKNLYKEIKKKVKEDGHLMFDDHSPIHELLMNKYQILMNSVINANQEFSKEIQEKYSKKMSESYNLEFSNFFSDVKNIIKKLKDGKSHRFSIGDKNNYELDNQVERVDLKFDFILTLIGDVIFKEESFCLKFFNEKEETIQNNLNIMFKRALENGFESMIKFMKSKIDWSFTISMIIIIQEKIKFYKSQFISFYFNILLKMVKYIFQEYIDKQISDIKSYSCSIKKVNITHFVSKFYLFYDKMEDILSIFKEKDLLKTSIDISTIMDSYYDEILKVIFNQIDILALSDMKHTNSFKMKNYYFLYNTIKDKKLNPKLIQSSKDIFEKSRNDYVKWIIKEKFQDLWSFLEGVEEYVNTPNFDIEDIAYQTQFSKKRLESICKQYDTSIQIMKDILQMKQRLEKHLGPKSGESEICLKYNLSKECWRFLVTEFKSQYERFEINVRKCFHIDLQPSLKTMIEAFFDIEKENRTSMRPTQSFFQKFI